MMWPFNKQRDDADAISMIHGVPKGFFKCGKCGRVYPETRFTSSVWEEGKNKMLCKNCMDIGLKDPPIPKRLRRSDRY
jgi:hypothetical protein